MGVHQRSITEVQAGQALDTVQLDSSLTRWERKDHAQDRSIHGGVMTRTPVYTTRLQPCLGSVPFLGYLDHARVH